MAAKKRTRTDREVVVAEVARLDRRGYSQRQIASLLRVSQQQVMYDLKQIRQRYAESQVASHAEKVAEKLDQYAEVRREAWEAWERSKQDARKRVEKSTPLRGEDGAATRAVGELTESVEGQCGDPRYLRTVLECFEAERQLLGLDAARELNARMQVVDLRGLSELLDRVPPREIEARVVDAMARQLGEVTADGHP